MSAELELAA
jgi:hypothetical protein